MSLLFSLAFVFMLTRLKETMAHLTTATNEKKNLFIKRCRGFELSYFFFKKLTASAQNKIASRNRNSVAFEIKKILLVQAPAFPVIL